MRTETRRLFRTRVDSGGISWTALALLGLSFVWGICSWLMLFGPSESQSAAFTSAAGWFVIFAIAFWHQYGLGGAIWASVPVLLAIELLVVFLCLPVVQLATGNDTLDESSVHALLLVLIGFCAFSIGAVLLKKGPTFHFVIRVRESSDRLTYMSVAMFSLGIAAKLLMWRGGVFSYTANAQVRASSYGYLQWLDYLGTLLNLALVISAIEVIGKRSTRPLIQLVFWLSLVSLIGFGIISGMKGDILSPLVCILLVYGIVKERIPRAVVILPVLLVVFIVPFVGDYRNNLNNGYRAQINTLQGLEAAITKSLNDVVGASDSTSTNVVAGYASEITRRLSYLSALRTVIGLTNREYLNGNERIWLAPVYPFVPRFLWTSKPIFNKGQRISIALGYGSQTSTAPTLIGDLFLLYGTYGVAIGMLIWGGCLQLYMNWLGRRGVSEAGLFFYISLMPKLLSFESDAIAFIGGIIQFTVFALVVSRIAYSLPVQSVMKRDRFKY